MQIRLFRAIKSDLIACSVLIDHSLVQACEKYGLIIVDGYG
jgi:hypothetical protein